MSLLEKIEFLKDWLRYHGEYTISIELWELYGCTSLTIKKLGDEIAIFRGMVFERRIDQAIKFVQEETEHAGTE